MDKIAFGEGFKNTLKAGAGNTVSAVTSILPKPIQKFIGRRALDGMDPQTKADLANEEIGKQGYGDFGSMIVGADGKLTPKINWGGAAKGVMSKLWGGIKNNPLTSLGIGVGGLGLMSMLGGGNGGGNVTNNYYSNGPGPGQTIKPNLQANIQSGDGFSASGYHQA